MLKTFRKNMMKNPNMLFHDGGIYKAFTRLSLPSILGQVDSTRVALICGLPWFTLLYAALPIFSEKNREFLRLLALFCANCGYICIFAIVLHPLALFCVFLNGRNTPNCFKGSPK